jgi:predicted lipoprotein DUF2279
MIAVLGSMAHADPTTPDATHHDPVAASTASSTSSASTPWIDLGPSHVLDVERAQSSDTPARDHKVAAALTLGGLYAGFTTWTYFAWYRKHKPLSEYNWACFFCNKESGDGNAKIWSKEGWFSATTYAGGADKLGHAWATMGLARAGTEMLNQWGGYDRLTSSLIGTALSEALFLGVEIKDGFYYEFSFGDLTFNTIGAGLALLFSNFPRLDELFDYRVEYWPSDAYRAQLEGGNLNIAEDYSGETYLLAFHLGGIHSLRDSKYGPWFRFVDVVAGYGTRGYKPEPPPGADPYAPSQHMFIGVSLNAQGIFDYLLEGRSNAARKITHGLFEMFNAPFSSLPLVKGTKTPDGMVHMGGA